MIESMKTARYFALAIIVLLAASCQKAMEKSEVEAGFAAKGALPEVTIDLTNYTIEELKASATVSATFANVPAADVVELGFLVSTSPDMSSATAVILEDTTDGTYTTDVKVKTGTINYVVATAATLDGSVYSEVLELDVPKVLWYKSVASKYKTDLYSYFEEVGVYEKFEMGVVLDLEKKTLTLNNLDAWAADQGVPTTLTGTIDLDTRVATFDCSDQFVDHGIADYGFYLVALDPEALAVGDFVIMTSMQATFSEDGLELNMPLWATVNGQGQIADIYLPATFTAVQ